MLYKLKEDYKNDYDIDYLLSRLTAFANRLKPLLENELYYKLFSEPKSDIKPEDYTYKEVCHTYMLDGEKKWSKWTRVKSNTIMKYLKQYNCHEVYYTVQKFRFPEKVYNEDFIMPLYFDLDASDGHVITDTLLEARKIVQFLIDLKIPTNMIQIAFSGSKGFHIIVHEKIFDFQPAKDMHKQIKHLQKKLNKILELKTNDLSAGNRKMLRIQNTLNRKSGLYKVSISTKGLFNATIEGIMAMAKQPKKKVPIKKPITIPKAKKWVKKMLAD
ncbi:unnamed protein product, partial [marine sediment metagenome]